MVGLFKSVCSCITFFYVFDIFQIEELTRRCWTENLQIIHLIKLIIPYLFDDSVLVNYAVYDKQAKQPKKNFCDLSVCNVIFSEYSTYVYNIVVYNIYINFFFKLNLQLPYLNVVNMVTGITK